jgi:Na+-driven multidrug efflux pump
MPGLGVTGSALGTVISNVLLDSVLVYLLVRRNIKFRVRLKGVLKPRIVFFSSILKLGVPVGAEFILWSIGQAAIISMINRIDNVSSGWFGAIIVLTNLAIQLYSGIGTATLVLIGQATGANRHREVLPISMYGMAYAQFSCLLVGILFLIIPDALLSLFIPNPESRQILQPMMGYAALIMFFKALNIISGNSIRGTGNTLWMLYTQIGGTILIIIVAALFIFNLNMGLAGLLLALVADEGTRGVINLIKFLLSQKKYRILKSFEFVH